jgi:hypothetical protein
VDVVTAGAPELDGAAVDEEPVGGELDFPETDLLDSPLDFLPVDPELRLEGVEVRVLRVPEKWSLDRNLSFPSGLSLVSSRRDGLSRTRFPFRSRRKNEISAFSPV